MRTTTQVRLRRVAITMVSGLALLGAGVALAAPAGATPGLQRVAAQSGTTSSATKTVAAYCPAGTVAWGGGGFAAPSRPSDVKIRALGVHETDTGSYYSITADVASDTASAGPWTLYATAICAPRPAGYELRSSYTPFGPGQLKGVTASCSAGKKVLSVGGYVYVLGGGAAQQLTLNGFALNGDSGGSLFGQTWRYGYSGSWMSEVDLVCANPVPGYSVQHATTQVAGGVADHAAHGVGSACPAGTTSVGLGAAVGMLNQRVQPFFVNIYPGSVYVQAAADTEGEASAWSITAQVVCAT